MPRSRASLSPALALAAAAVTLAACGQKDGRGADTAVGAGTGGLSAPAVGAGGEVNGRGITDSNAARTAASGGTGAPNNSGIGSPGAPSGAGGGAGGAAGASTATETGTTTGAAGAGAPVVGPTPRPGVPGTDTARGRRP